MNDRPAFIEPKGFYIALITFFLCLGVYYHYSSSLYYSSFGAGFSAFLVWGSYVILRMIILASRN